MQQTRDLVDTCMAFIRKGVNFHNMESIIREEVGNIMLTICIPILNWAAN